MIKKGVGRGFESLLAYLEKFLTFQKKYDIIIIDKQERNRKNGKRLENSIYKYKHRKQVRF